ncbi:MAG: BolA/IbaG family iron-sulfur metabolism protein [Holosporales bacterium]
MALKSEVLLEMLRSGFPDAEIDLKDTMGDQDHYAVVIRSDAFKGLSRVQQHQLVYRCLGAKMGTTLHALSLRTEAKESST